jgi:hypothetical protein
MQKLLAFVPHRIKKRRRNIYWKEFFFPPPLFFTMVKSSENKIKLKWTERKKKGVRDWLISPLFFPARTASPQRWRPLVVTMKMHALDLSSSSSSSSISKREIYTLFEFFSFSFYFTFLFFFYLHTLLAAEFLLAGRRCLFDNTCLPPPTPLKVFTPQKRVGVVCSINK